MGIEIRPAAVMAQLDQKGSALSQACEEIRGRVEAIGRLSSDDGLSGAGYDAAKARFAAHAAVLTALETAAVRVAQVDAQVSGALSGYFGGRDRVSEDEWRQRQDAANAVIGALDEYHEAASASEKGMSESAEASYRANRAEQEEAASQAGEMLSRIYQYCEQTNGAYGDADLAALMEAVGRAMGAISAAGWDSSSHCWGAVDADAMEALTDAVDAVVSDIESDGGPARLGFDEDVDYAGDPVSLSDGGFVWSRGYFGWRGAPVVTVTYNSTDPEGGALGRGWRHSLEARLSKDGDGGVSIVWGDGSSERFREASAGVWSEARGRDEHARRTASGWRVEDGRGDRWSFDDAGRLSSALEGPDRRARVRRGEDGAPAKADVRGLGLTFSYDGEGRLASVEDGTGRSVSFERDDDGRLVGISDETGATTSFSYDGDGLVSEVRDGEGRLACANAYDGEGRVVSQRLPGGTMSYAWDGRAVRVSERDGSSTRHRADAFGRSSLSVDELGGASTRSFDARDWPAGNKTPSGSAWSQERDRCGRLLSTADPTGRETRLEWEGGLLPRRAWVAGRVVMRSVSGPDGLPRSVADGAGDRELLRYDALGRLSRVVAPDGAKASLAYEGASRLPSSSTDPVGRVTRYGWDAWGDLASVERPDGTVERWERDARGRLLSHASPDGGVERWERDRSGKVVSHVDALGQETRVSYDEGGCPVSVAWPDGSEARLDNGPRGELRRVLWPDGGETSLSYDAAMRLVGLSYPGGAKTRLSLDEDGRVAGVGSPYGSCSYAYDAAGRPTRVDGPRGAEERSYDEAGRLSERRFADGTSARYSYDEAGRLARFQAGGYEVRLSYDACGRLASREDTLGRKASYAYDALGRRTSQDGVDGPVSFSYSEDGRTVTAADGAGEATETRTDAVGRPAGVRRPGDAETARYAYDKAGRLASVTDPTGRATSFSYDGSGEAVRRDDGGVVRTWERDAMGRTVRTEGPDGARDYEYDASGALARATGPEGAAVVENDPAGRPLSVSYPDGSTLSYSYDGAGRRSSVTVDGVEVRYSYDGAGRLSRVEAGDGWCEMSYGEDGTLCRRAWSDGTVQGLSLDPAGRLSSMSIRDAKGHEDSFAYEWDGRDDLASAEASRWGAPGLSGRFAYGYDGAGRLATVTKDGEELERYSYDARGNRTASADGAAYSYDAADRLVERADSAGATRYAWDGAGCLSSAAGPSGTASFSMDDEGSPMEAATPAGGRVRFLRDPFGNASGVEGSYSDLVDPAARAHRLLRRRSEAGERVYAQTPLGCVGAVDPATGAFEPVVCDLLGQALRVCRGGGFGEALGSTAFGVPLAADPLAPFGAFGYAAEPATGLLLSPTRVYDPSLGRFLSPDPDGGAPDRPHTLNRYAYAASNPTRYCDPTGGFVNLAAAVAGTGVGFAFGAGIEIGSELLQGKSFDDLDGGKILAKGAEGAVTGGVGGLTCGASLVAGGAANAAAIAGTNFLTGAAVDAVDQVYVEGTAQGSSAADIAVHAVGAGALNAFGTSIGGALMEKYAVEPVGKVLTNKMTRYAFGRDAFADARPDELLAKTTKGQWAALFGALGVKQTDSEAVVTGFEKASERLSRYMRAGCGEGAE